MFFMISPIEKLNSTLIQFSLHLCQIYLSLVRFVTHLRAICGKRLTPLRLNIGNWQSVISNGDLTEYLFFNDPRNYDFCT
jgi:hypothetical protein